MNFSMSISFNNNYFFIFFINCEIYKDICYNREDHNSADTENVETEKRSKKGKRKWLQYFERLKHAPTHSCSSRF